MPNHPSVALRPFFLASLLSLSIAAAAAGAELRPFTITDDIGLAQFDDPSYTGKADGVEASPDGKWVVIHTERGSLPENRVTAELRLYRLDELRDFVNASGDAPVPAAAWSISSFSSREGPAIEKLRWLEDSTGIVVMAKTDASRDRLFLADLNRRDVKPLTAEDQDVTAFDVRDRTHYAFTIRCGPPESISVEQRAPAVFATGRSLSDIFDSGRLWRRATRSFLWAACGGPARPLVDPSTGEKILIYSNGQRNFRLSPDGRALATSVCFSDVPADWERRFPPAFPAMPSQVHAGRQDLTVPYDIWRLIDQFVQIDLGTGRVTPLTGTPTAMTAGWFGSVAPISWSDDGRLILLPGAFLPNRAPGSAPHIIVADRNGHALESLDVIARDRATGYDPDYHWVWELKFAPGRSDRVVAKYMHMPSMAEAYRVYSRTGDGTWKLESDQPAPPPERKLVQVAIEQDLNKPQVAVATDPATGKSRLIWDPNPQLKQFTLGDTSVYRWTDRTGRKWLGGLYRPPGFVAGHRYPLVIQTHGFMEKEFRTSGVFPTAFAARALAGAGMMVLQVRDAEGRQHPEEGPNNVRGYEAAIAQLSGEGLIDPERVGIVGFSRTVYYVLSAITSSTLRFKAASVTDGINVAYLEYILAVDAVPGVPFLDALIGGPPFGASRDLWLKRSPNFNLDKVNAPLLVTGMKGLSTLFMWEPYAALRYLHKPVELMVLNSEEHVLTNPAVRLASQGTNVDWFRFWLKDEEDPAPAKAEQYTRWRKLRELRDADLRKSEAEKAAKKAEAPACVGSP